MTFQEKIICPARTAKGVDAKIEWSKVHSQLPINSSIDESGALLIPQLSHNDSGTYTCTVTTKEGYRVKLNISLIVHGKEFC